MLSWIKMDRSYSRWSQPFQDGWSERCFLGIHIWMTLYFMDEIYLSSWSWGRIPIMVGHIIDLTPYGYKSNHVHHKHWKIPCGCYLGWEMDHRTIALWGVSRIAWNAIFIISIIGTILLFHFFKNHWSLFNNIVMMMNERVDNIFRNIIWMRWINGTMGDHFPKKLTKLDRWTVSLHIFLHIYFYIWNYIVERISKQVLLSQELARNRWTRPEPDFVSLCQTRSIFLTTLCRIVLSYPGSTHTVCVWWCV